MRDGRSELSPSPTVAFAGHGTLTGGQGPPLLETGPHGHTSEQSGEEALLPQKPLAHQHWDAASLCLGGWGGAFAGTSPSHTASATPGPAPDSRQPAGSWGSQEGLQPTQGGAENSPGPVPGPHFGPVPPSGSSKGQGEAPPRTTVWSAVRAVPGRVTSGQRQQGTRYPISL